MNRRTLLKTGGLAAVGTLTVGVSSCAKNLSTWVNILIGAAQELSSLLPGQSALISKAVAIAKSFDEAYRAGKFIDAMSIFENLANVVDQVTATLGVTNPTVKLAISMMRIALRAIATLLKAQAQNPAVAAALSDPRLNNDTANRQKALVEKLADESAINALYVAAKP
jgi:hypothetical protein